MTETVLANAQLVLEDETIRGAIRVADGKITAIDPGSHVPKGAEDCAGDFVAPGLIELHTDNLERHMQPRPGVKWPLAAAVLAHDAELGSVGITTVYDALRVGSVPNDDRGPKYDKYARPVADQILAHRGAGNLKISHFLHLRAEICSETLVEEFAEFGPEDRIGIVSLMDHTPGQRQFRDLSKLEEYLVGKHGMSRDQVEAHYQRLYDLRDRLGSHHEREAVARGKALGAVLASHDDTTAADVDISAGHGVRFAEFPTTREAAEACQAQGISIIMGAPNLLRGGSHSGNVAAGELAQAGLLDILSSDYAPSSLMMAAVKLGQETGDMAAGLARVTAQPARAAGLDDRGRLAPGLRADLVRFRVTGGFPVIREVWSQGQRI